MTHRIRFFFFPYSPRFADVAFACADVELPALYLIHRATSAWKCKITPVWGSFFRSQPRYFKALLNRPSKYLKTLVQRAWVSEREDARCSAGPTGVLAWSPSVARGRTNCLEPRAGRPRGVSPCVPPAGGRKVHAQIQPEKPRMQQRVWGAHRLYCHRGTRVPWRVGGCLGLDAPWEWSVLLLACFVSREERAGGWQSQGCL